MSVALASLRRDFLIWTSYRLAAFWQVMGIFVMIALIYFGGTAIGDHSDFIQQEGGSYVAFILVGLAFMDVLAQGLQAIPRAINDNQRAGTLEPLLLAPMSGATLLTSFWLFRFLFSVARMSVFVLVGLTAFGYWHSANPVSVLLVLIPAELAFMAMGALSAAFMILVKQGDPVLIAYSAITAIFGGAIFPTSALPHWLQVATLFVPLTYALDGVREGLAGGGLRDVAPQAGVLAAMTLVLLPLGLMAFNTALNRAKREGSLGEY
jgi:ABC-2 type transport system permease protein